MAGSIRLELFGSLQVVREGVAITRIHVGKPGALLGYLALHAGHAIDREVLIELLWPEADPSAGRKRLKQALCVLRRHLESEENGLSRFVLADRDFLSVDATAVVTDVAEFECLLNNAEMVETEAGQLADLEHAVRLCRQDFLAGHFDDWVLSERERLAARGVSALRKLTYALERLGEPSRAAEHARQWVAADPLQEEPQTALIRLYLKSDRRAEARQAYQDYARLLKEDLGELPPPALRDLATRLTTESVRPTMADVPMAGRPDREPIGGAVPLRSRYYIDRPTDECFRTALIQQDSIVLVKGPRQVGKTSLLIRGVAAARDIGFRTVVMDLQKLNAEQLSSLSEFYLACARRLVDGLDLDVAIESSWDPRRSDNDNFERFVRREVLGRIDGHLIWALDEVDRLLPKNFSAEAFSLFRSWHNERSLDVEGPWSRLTLAIAYATEAHLFISDLNQSPFNVGTRLTLQDFGLGEVAELNRRYGAPLRDSASINRFYSLLGGNPYLVRRGLSEIAGGELNVQELEDRALSEESPFRDHLQRMLLLTEQDGDVSGALKSILRTGGCASADAFYRLRSAGVIVGDTHECCRPRCDLYTSFLTKALL